MERLTIAFSIAIPIALPVGWAEMIYETAPDSWVEFIAEKLPKADNILVCTKVPERVSSIFEIIVYPVWFNNVLVAAP